METGRRSITLSDGAREGLQRARSLNGRTSGPTRRSTKGQWTPEEDETLRMAVQHFKGKNWKKIAECFKDRTDVQCLHRWQKVLNPELVKGPWSKEEDEAMIELVNKYGPKKWSTIAKHLPGRIGKQCRERWHNHLNPEINRAPWTQDEEVTLIRAHQIYGNKWAELTKLLPGRTDNAIKNQWHSSVKKKLDMYMASGLLSQFQDAPLISHENQAAASSKAHPSGKDGSTVRDGAQVEEIPDSSQGSGFVGLSANDIMDTTVNTIGDSKVNRESSQYISQTTGPVLYSEDYPPARQDDSFPEPEVPCEGGHSSKYFENDFSLDWMFADENWQPNSNGQIDVSLPNPGQESSGSPQNAISDYGIDASIDLLLSHSLDVEIPEDERYAVESPNMQGTPFPVSGIDADQFSDSLLENEVKGCVRPSRHDRSGSLLCQSPHPSLDIPFFNCNLLQSGGKIQEQYSPLGLRQLMVSSLTPFKLWDSPKGKTSPDLLLKATAENFTAPSILKKRHRDLVSPLSERQIEKRLESEPMADYFAKLANDFSQLEVMFDESFDLTGPSQPSTSNDMNNLEACFLGKENENPVADKGKKKIHERTSIPESRVVDTKKAGSSNVLQTEKEVSGILVENDINSLLFFSPGRVLGNKSSRSVAGVSGHDTISSSTGTPLLSVICSPRVSAKKGRASMLITTSLESLSSPKIKTDSSNKNPLAESSSIFLDTPFRRSLESPSAAWRSPSTWKSPWFINSFSPGPRVDTDITIEDIGIFMSPGQRGNDAIGLMDQFGEETTATFADALADLADNNPEDQEEEKENDSQTEEGTSISEIMTERRTLDFSDCVTPQKETRKLLSSTGHPSSSSYLVKGFR